MALMRTAHFHHTGCLHFASNVGIPEHTTQVLIAWPASLSVYSVVLSDAGFTDMSHIPATLQSCTTASSLYNTVHRQIFITLWLGLLQMTTAITNWMSRWSRIGLLSMHLTEHDVLPSKTQKRHGAPH